MDERAASRNCQRAREVVSLGLDAEISELETALLVAHLRRCAACSRFARDVSGFTRELRGASLDLPSRSLTVQLPRARRRHALRGATAAAALVVGLLGVFSALDLSSNGDGPSGPGLVFRSQGEQQRFVRSQTLRLEPASEAEGIWLGGAPPFISG